MSAESANVGAGDFSFELRVEIARALGSYLEHGSAAREHLLRATQRVCTEAHALSLTPEQVVDMLKRLFERTPLTGDGEPERRRAAWEEFTQSCISAYFNAGDHE
jgi:hypothetical protein